ncbi:MAG: response regulator [Hungatella sp.]|uniref:response regulator n=1 Tax=Hungatella sp. TaxID=2613924 RepID=UPI003992F9E5
MEWESLGITEVFIAYSLKQAQDIFAAHTINLLISDIEMPKGSGLYLLSWLRCEGNRVQVIFLTNHADFHYASEGDRPAKL